MGERTLTFDTKKLIADSAKDLTKAKEKIDMLMALGSDKKKIKKLKKCRSVIEAATVIIDSLATELNK